MEFIRTKRLCRFIECRKLSKNLIEFNLCTDFKHYQYLIKTIKNIIFSFYLVSNLNKIISFSIRNKVKLNFIRNINVQICDVSLLIKCNKRKKMNQMLNGNLLNNNNQSLPSTLRVTTNLFNLNSINITNGINDNHMDNITRLYNFNNNNNNNNINNNDDDINYLEDNQNLNDSLINESNSINNFDINEIFNVNINDALECIFNLTNNSNSININNSNVILNGSSSIFNNSSNNHNYLTSSVSSILAKVLNQTNSTFYLNDQLHNITSICNLNNSNDNIKNLINFNNSVNNNFNLYSNHNDNIDSDDDHFHWNFLFVIIFILTGTLGNILVCLAVALDRKLQNVTNYFLFSLAIADLLVSLFVMPLGAIPGFLGYWPFGFYWCNIYVTCDVLACSSSILHMCFISVGRYLGIRNPLGARHHSTKRLAGIKIFIVWIMAMIVSSSITVLGIYDPKNIMKEPYVCVINNRAFFVFGSLVAFYIPMITMVVTYSLTIKLLRKKARFAIEHPEGDVFRRLGGRYTMKPIHSTSNEQNRSFRISNESNRSFKQTAPKKILTSSGSRDSFGSTIDDIPGSSNRDSFKSITSNRNRNSNVILSKVLDSNSTIERENLSEQSSLELQQLQWKGNNSENSRKFAAPVRITRSTSKIRFLTNGGNARQFNETNQTSETIFNDEKKCKTKGLKFNFNSVAPPAINFNLRFLHPNKKRNNLSANAVATEQKASKVLGLVFFTFVLCWSPFFILNIFFACCPECTVPENIIDLCLWLGYVSSTINPIIYTIFNRTFRAAFIRLLKCNCKRSGHAHRFRSVSGNRGGLNICAPAATLPLALSLEPLMASSTNTVSLVTPSIEFNSNECRGTYKITDHQC